MDAHFIIVKYSFTVIYFLEDDNFIKIIMKYPQYQMLLLWFEIEHFFLSAFHTYQFRL